MNRPCALPSLVIGLQVGPDGTQILGGDRAQGVSSIHESATTSSRSRRREAENAEEAAAGLAWPPSFAQLAHASDTAHQPSDALGRYFDAIAEVAGIHLRLGHRREIKKPRRQYPLLAALKKPGISKEQLAEHFEFRPQLEQKGVDTLIVLDLVRLAERGVSDVAVLVAGDRDLAEAVRPAQDIGRTVVVAVPEGAGAAKELRRLADLFVEIPKQDVGIQAGPLTPHARAGSGRKARTGIG